MPKYEKSVLKSLLSAGLVRDVALTRTWHFSVLSSDSSSSCCDSAVSRSCIDVKGSPKVHIKLNLEVDIRIIAKFKGDIAIGIL